MATDRVGIEIDIMGYDEAMSQMKSLDAAVKGLQGRKNFLKIKAQVEELKMNKKALQSNKVKLKADMTDVDAKIKKLRSQLKSLEAQKPLYKINSPAFTKLAQKIAAIKTELRSLESQRINLGDQFAKTTAEINASTAAINRMSAALKNAGMSGMSLGQIFKKSTSSIAHVGSALQSAGNAIVRLTSPLRTITSGALMGVGYKAMNTIQEGLASGFSRYDTMKKYPKMMAEYSKESYTAEQSINDLNDAVLGLPTGLDEIVDVAQRYTLTVGDMEKGTKLAIASNNAFLASMATDTQKYQGMMQLQDLMNGKKLQSREWMSLGSSMGKAINEVGKEFGYTNDNMKEFRKALYAGEIAGDDFLDALIKVGTGTGKIAKLADNSKDTWEAFTTNVGTAFSRMTYGILSSLDEISQTAFGMDVNQLLSSVVPAKIDAIATSAKSWIKANPDKIIGFFNDLKSIDWAGIGKGFVAGVGNIVGMFQKMAKIIGGKNLAAFGKFSAYLPMIGNGLLVFGGLLKGGRHIFGGITTGLIGIGRALSGVGIEKLGGKLGKIGEFFKNLGKTKKEIDAAEAITGATGKGGKAAGAATKAYFVSLGKTLSAVGAGIAIAVGSTWGLKTSLKQLKETADLMKEIDWKALAPIGEGLLAVGSMITGAKGIMSAIGYTSKPGVILKGFAPIAEVVGAVGGIITEVLAIGAVDTALLKTSMNNLVSITGGMQAVFDNVAGIKSTNVSKDGLRDAVNDLFDIYDIIYGETETTRVAGKTATTQRNAKGLNKMKGGALKKIKDSVASMGEIFHSMQDIRDTLKDLKGFKGFDTGKGKGSTIEAMQNFTADLGSIYDSFVESFDKNVDADKAAEFSGIVSQAQTMFSSIQNIAEMVPELAKKVASGIGSQTGRGTPFEKLKSTLTGEGGLFSGINEIFTAINEKLLGLDGEAGGTSFSADAIGRLSGVMESVQAMFTQIGTLVTTLQDIQPQMAKMTQQGSGTGGRGTALASLKTQIVGLMKDLGEIYAAFDSNLGSFDADTINDQMQGMVTAINKIRTAVNKLSELGSGQLSEGDGSAAFAAIDSIKSLISRLGSALNTDAIGEIQTQVETFRQSVTDLFTTLNSDLSNVEVEVHINGKVTGADALVSEINSARDAILSAVRRIPSTINKTVSVNINRSVNVGGDSIPTSLTPHTGGYVGGPGKLLYRSKGGGIGNLFKPKGTDTVPAMLTPGEYVMKKQAVDNFGVRFMQRINNLDIAGAMRELSAKAGITSAAARSTVVYNNNVTNNNNPTINQNINTNNPNFAFKRSNRYVMAL